MNQNNLELRDYFAAQAMNSLIGEVGFPTWLASEAYIIADAMLAAREEKKEWVSLDEDECVNIFEKIGDPKDFCKTWGYLQFAREIERLCREKNGC